MERAAFLIEDSGARIPCLLNPASVVLRRAAGVRPRFSVGGPLTGAGVSDSPLLFTGGGTTEITMDLLFDVSLARSDPPPENVRELTEPLWRLAENETKPGEYGRPPAVRFVWGKAWNIPGVVVAVSERLEYFTQAGTPQRSWLRLRMLRITSDEAEPTAPVTTPAEPGEGTDVWGPGDFPTPVNESDVRRYDLIGDGEGAAERPDAIAAACGFAPEDWPAIMEFSGVDDPTALQAGQTLRIPPSSTT
jgi:Contractile injection system tube protein